MSTVSDFYDGRFETTRRHVEARRGEVLWIMLMIVEGKLKCVAAMARPRDKSLGCFQSAL